ncbi:glycoside hydrolase family 5 protein [Coraliomargarita parva]|uniref:glycoside hydrolase family 5 protein n=1 Tax=Coraliomargarita parva TaxID=3014050 RepID=UPI0022B3E268|nr:cellulase family glycosylhydrolase [Coraliomargarita parva]
MSFIRIRFALTRQYACLAIVLLALGGSPSQGMTKDRDYPKDPPAEMPQPENWPATPKVTGNRLTDPEGNEVWLQGVAIPGLEIIPEGHGAVHSTIVAIEDWNANVVRLAIKDDFWYGRGKSQTDGGLAYRAIVDAAVQAAANRGAYIVLDHHRYRAIKQEQIPFWQELATLYKNHPAVLFDIINEPHEISWEVWRNGGFVAENTDKINQAGFLDDKTMQANRGFESPGMQKMVEAVRATGARNVIIAGGLDWAYDLSGILKGYALEDPSGNGIMYSTHIYNWKRNWQKAFLDAAEHHPIFIGEVGADVKKMSFIPEDLQEDPYTWVPDMLGVIQQYRLNWTAWSFHTWATPVLLSDWAHYTPSPFWGDFAKRALAGEQFEFERLR